MAWDTNLLLFINGNHHPFADLFFFHFTSGLIPLILLTILTLYLLVWQKMDLKSYGIFIGLLFGVLVGSEYIASGLFKPWVARLRPSHEPALLPLLHLVHDYRGGGYGFISAHATNSAAAFIVMFPFLRARLVRLFFLTALFLFSFSRIYLGVHYPSDVIAGWLVGSLWAYAILRLALWQWPWLLSASKRKEG